MGVNFTNACYPGETANVYLFYFMMFINILIVSKSMFVIIMTCRIPDMQENMAIVFASMSVNDLILAVIVTCDQVSTMPISTFDFLKSNLMTCLMFGNCYGTLVVSMMHLAVLALDRYIHILHPLYYIRYVTKRRVSAALFCVWTTGIIIMSTPMIVFTDAKYHVKCLLFHPPMVYYSVISFIYCIIVLSVFVCYFKIARLAFRRTKAANSRRLNLNDMDAVSLYRINRISAVRSINFFIIMFGIFALFSIPFVAKTWISYFVSIADYVHRSIFFVIPGYAFLNGAMYIKMSRDFSSLIQSTCSKFVILCCTRKQ